MKCDCGENRFGATYSAGRVLRQLICRGCGQVYKFTGEYLTKDCGHRVFWKQENPADYLTGLVKQTTGFREG